MNKVNRYFDTEIAKKFDTDTAIILYNIQFWIELNTKNKNEHNFKNGKYWTFNSANTFTEVFDWLSEKQIRTRLNKLVESGYLEEGNFNKRGGDKTKWYSLTNRSDQMVNCSSQMVSCSDQTGTCSDQMVSATSQMVRPLPDIKQQMLNTDIKQHISLVEKKSKSKKQKDIEVKDVHKVILDCYNFYFRKGATPSKDFSWTKNADKWLETYSLEEIKVAMEKWSLYDHWSKSNDKTPSLSLMFRTRDRSGDAVNYIDQLLALGDTPAKKYRTKEDEEFARLWDNAL